MNLTRGSILNFAPDHGWAAVIKHGDTLLDNVPIIGWATEISWARDDDPRQHDEPQTHETRLTPVMLVDGEALTEHDLRQRWDAVPHLYVEITADEEQR